MWHDGCSSWQLTVRGQFIASMLKCKVQNGEPRAIEAFMTRSCIEKLLALRRCA